MRESLDAQLAEKQARFCQAEGDRGAVGGRVHEVIPTTALHENALRPAHRVWRWELGRGAENTLPLPWMPDTLTTMRGVGTKMNRPSRGGEAAGERPTNFLSTSGNFIPNDNHRFMDQATKNHGAQSPTRWPFFMLTIHSGAQQPLRFATRAADRCHAKIIGLHTGLHRGIVETVEAQPLPMKTKNQYRSGQLLLAL